MDQQRGYSDDGDQRWYGADPGWDRARHGSPAEPEETPAYDPAARYQTGSLFDVGPRSGEPIPPMSGPPSSAPPAAPVDAPRRSMEAIDVAALRRGGPPEQPAGFAAPDYPAPDYPAPDYPAPDYAAQAGPGYAAAPAPSYTAQPSVDYGAAEYPLYPGASESPVAGASPPAGGLESLGLGGGTTYQGGGSGGAIAAVGGPTSAHNTVGTYRGRRPVMAIVVAVVVALLEIAALRVLINAFFRGSPSVSETAAAIFLALGLPMFGIGGYALVSGATAGNADWRVWTRVPLVYLPLGIVLFVCAALAG